MVERFNGLMGVPSTRWSVEDRQFMSRLIHQQLGEMEAAQQAALPSDLNALRAGIVDVLRQENQ